MRPLVCLLLLASVARAAEPVPDWKSIADPPKEKPAWAVDPNLNVVTPPHFFDGGIEFAAQGGPFVAVGRNGGKGEYRIFVDLRTGETYGTLKDELDAHGLTALSTDGKKFAIVLGGRFGQKATVAVVDVASGKVTELPVKGELDVLQFAGDRLLVSSKTETDVYNVQNWKSMVNLDHQRNPWGGAKSTLTPTGRFLVETSGQGLRVYDVESGRSLFKMDSPKSAKGATNADGVAFSPDGKRMAVATEAYGHRTLVVYDTETGKPLFDNVVAIKNVFHPVRVAWSVDSQGVLLNGEAIVDPETGKPIFEFPAGSHGTRLAVTLGRAVVWDTSDRAKRRLAVVGHGPELTAAMKAAAVHGTAADALLPPLTKVALDVSKAVPVPLVGEKWAAAPDPAPPTPAVLRPLRTDFTTRNLRAFFVTAGPSPVALFEFTPHGGDATKPRQARRVDLLTGKTTATFEVPPTLQTEDVSPTGSKLVTFDPVTGRRVDVFPLDGGKPTSFRPFDDQPDGGKKVAVVRFLTDDRVLTVSEKGVIAAWSLPDLKLSFAAELPGGKAFTLSPNRKYLAAQHAGAVRVLDTTTGAWAGDLVPTAGTQETPLPSFVMFRGDGREVLAGFQDPKGGAFLSRWDTATGTLIAEDPFAGTLGSRPKPGYVGDHHVMFDFGWLYDLKRKAFVWNAAVPPGQGAFAWSRPDDRVWYFVNGFDNDGMIVAAPFPTAETERVIADVIDGPGALLKPGTKVALKLQTGGGLADEYRPKIMDALRKAWAARELAIVNDGADVTVAMTVGERDTGEKLSFRRTFGGPLGGESVNVLELTTETELSANGEVLWSPEPVKHRTHSPFFLQLPKDETDIGRHLHKQMWNEVVTWGQNSALPRFLAKTDAGVKVLPQFSKLTPAGVTDEVKGGR
jgi:hypothetical protein